MTCTCCPPSPEVFRVDDFHTATDAQLTKFLGSRKFGAVTIGHRSELDGVTIQVDNENYQLTKNAPVIARIEGALSLTAFRNQLSTTLSATVKQPESVLELLLWPRLPTELPTARGGLLKEGNVSFAASGGDAALSTDTRMFAAPIYGRRQWRVALSNEGANSADVRVSVERVRSDGNIDSYAVHPTPGDATAQTTLAAGAVLFVSGVEPWDFVSVWGEAAAATNVDYAIEAED